MNEQKNGTMKGPAFCQDGAKSEEEGSCPFQSQSQSQSEGLESQEDSDERRSQPQKEDPNVTHLPAARDPVVPEAAKISSKGCAQEKQA